MANTGWNADLPWGTNNWGDLSDATVATTGLGLSVGIGNESIKIDVAPEPTGQQLSANVNSVTAFGLAQVPVTGESLTLSAGNIDAAPDAEVTGSQVNIGQGSVTVTAEINQGWGRLTWGQNDWGTYTLSVVAEPTGQQLTLTTGTAEGKPVTIAEPSGIGLTVAEGTVDPSPDATVVGIGLSASVAVGSVIEADANVTTTGIDLTNSLGTAVLDAVTFGSPTGQQLSSTIDTVVAGASAEVDLTGIGLTVGLRSINVQSWQIVDTGTSVTWTAAA